MTLAFNKTASAKRGRRSPSVVVIGAGMSGVCMGIKLKQAGIEDFVILEKGTSVGGTWRENTYPGLTCDVPSHLYQYTFDKNAEWSHLFSPQPEIEGYFSGAAERFGIVPHIRFGEEVLEAVFEGAAWRVKTSKGEYTADFLVAASGVLHKPRMADIPGVDKFEGALFHSARWDHSVPLDGKRVAVVGTGSTGVQIVSALQRRGIEVTLFQRTPQWVMPLPNPPTGPVVRLLLRKVPFLDNVFYSAMRQLFGIFAQATIQPGGWKYKLIDALCRWNLRTVRDKQLRAKLTPADKPMCKRLVMHPSFYWRMQQPNVRLVTEGIDHIEQRGVVTEDGELHEADVIAMCTGFDPQAFVQPVDLIGEGGRTLSQTWQVSNGPRAYRTVALPGFPNFFFIMGPHSPVGNFSLVAVAETQAKYIMRWIDRWREGQFDTAAPKQSVTDAYNAEIKEAAKTTIWNSGCNSWYLGKDGLPELWPWTPWAHEEMLANIAEHEFVFAKNPPTTPA
jgi:cation diffusion facilitator CzcD-associated flavoprotein CzcO